MIDALPIWISELVNLPKVNSAVWATNFANYYADRIVGIQTDPSALTSAMVFTFAKPVFEAQLMALMPVTDQTVGTLNFALAWEAAILASTAVVPPGAFIPPATPTTTFSVVISTVINPASIAAGKAKIMELATAPQVADASLSQFPIKFRDATLLLKVDVDGLDSTTPGDGGPLPLSAPMIPLV
jgi:hypothetical protein